MPRTLALSLLLSLALAAGPAFGAATSDKPKRRFMPAPPAAADVGLRGPLDAPLVAPAPPQSIPPLGLPAPGTALAGLSTAGFSAAPPISPLPQVGDPAPICRAACAKARIVCASSDDLSCDTRWVQCVADCSAPSFR